MKQRLLFVLGVIFCMTSGLTSQTWDKRIAVGAHTNIFKFWGGMYNRSTISSMIGLNAHYGIRPNVQVGLEFAYGSFRPSEFGKVFPKEDDKDFRTTAIPISVTVQATPFYNDIVKPYGLLGVGALFWNLKNIDENSPNYGESVHGQQANATVLAGVGIEWLFATSWALDLRAQNTFLLNQKLDNTGYEDDANSMMMEGRLGVSYYFGSYVDTDGDGVQDRFDGAPNDPEDRDRFQDFDGIPDPDNDNDGILDGQDDEPNRPEDIDGFQDEDGAPDPDNDGDGILDVNDQAPNDPEDRDGFQDNDGIPDPDNDGDGILDVNDGAPNEAEDLDGFQDGDGVPDYDNDQDGIADVNDQCPNEPETVNNYQDEDGCPDNYIPDIGADRLILEGITFATGSADLTPEARNILRTVANQLLVREDLRVRIVGHTDNTGNESYNRRLSKRRADAVKDFLVLNGIPANRLVTEGRGSRDPIADNSTEEGRARNRRIEFDVSPFTSHFSAYVRIFSLTSRKSSGPRKSRAAIFPSGSMR